MMERWARLKFAGHNHRWHAATEGWLIAQCGRQTLDYPRMEVVDGRPTTGKLCKHCLDALRRTANVEERKLYAAKRIG